MLPVCLVLIARVIDPAVRLQKDGRTKVFFRVPPVRGAGCAAAGTEDTFVETIEAGAFFFALEVFTTLEERRAGLVLW